MRAASVSDFRELARRRLPKIFFEYIDGGSYAEETLRRNVADLEAIALCQRVMRDMTQLDMSVQTLGQTLAMGETRRVHEDHDVELLHLGEERPEARIR